MIPIEKLENKIINDIRDIIFDEKYVYRDPNYICDVNWTATADEDFEYLIDNITYNVNVTFDVYGDTTLYRGDYYTPDEYSNVVSINNVTGTIYATDEINDIEIMDEEFSAEFNKKIKSIFQNIEY